ncbi:MAG TPA: sugar ABC transporter permease [Candidatus Atribacteria bacterium]|nr:MAG: sugar ABC transporter permease [Candidatus Nealsonbacteria bacterium]HDK28101.1 sugar ABC transporter permease [Candidatus Atribacteria bacterium]
MKKSRRAWIYIGFVAPALFIYLAVIAFPVMSSVLLSFTKYNVYKNTAVWIGLANYIKIFKEPVFWFSVRNNLFVIFVSVFGQIPIGFILAYIIYRKLVKHRNFFQLMVFLPSIISTVIVGILWSSLFSPIGAITKIIQSITKNPDYVMSIMTNKNLAMLPIGFVLLWMYTGTYLIIFLANLQNINPDVIEAAQIDGATNSQILTKVIIPQLYGVIVLTMILAISGSLKSFDLVFAMTGGGPAYYTNLLAIYMYNYSFIYANYGVGSAISTVMVFMCIVLIFMIRFIRSKIESMED